MILEHEAVVLYLKRGSDLMSNFPIILSSMSSFITAYPVSHEYQCQA